MLLARHYLTIAHTRIEGQLIKKLHRLSSEQLSRIENDMETMNAEMKEAEKHLTGMEKWCGLCVCPWNRFEDCLAFVEHF